ncbi:DNA replication/repair protein RecF [Desulforamulus aeronauticus]|uniref:DNA replication and repair protein RecF n=1 Tax=Desulforamulus aeronauticus DSM 10349 TaxID=1121421 RepID=A0A1M6T896_9FIRM|nr:DNA replication/repair protein RecF [Desulforamulus aeronauticus]SHK53262.1 DNA replication and repair protein RecF [Desulforamulus aeronauticus DSM 10349]
MRVINVTLKNFRNYQEESFQPHQAINIITGSNAQGKTNLLESIYYTFRGRSFRAERDKDIIHWQNDTTTIRTGVLLNSRNVDIKWKIKENNKKLIINGIDTPRAELDHFGVVLFCPEDLYLVKGSPQERRKFLDNDVGSLNPGYSKTWRQYARVLTQRNTLLKEIRDKRTSQTQDMLEVWDEQLYRHGARVIYLRLQILKKLIPIARSIHHKITEGAEELQAKYLSSLALEPGLTEEQIYQIFFKTGQKMRPTEIQRCQTMLGPHRDDLSLSLNGIEARSFGSQGQQRTVTLSLKLSQLELWYREFGDYPILLLDDVLFELDHSRQSMLLDKINKVQTFITTSFTGGIENTIKGAGLLWQVNAGNLTAKEEL